jgi:hypothetical protein
MILTRKTPFVLESRSTYSPGTPAARGKQMNPAKRLKYRLSDILQSTS